MSSAGRIRVMVVDDHPIMRNGLRDTLEASGRFEVVGLAEDGEEAAIEAVVAGAMGYLQNYSRPEELVEAVLDVARGRLRIPGKVVREVFAIVRGDREFASRQASAKLTALERETLTLFTSGRSYTETAEARGNSTVTVRNTLYHIQDKLGIKGKQELVIWAVRNGLADDVVVDNDPQTEKEESQTDTLRESTDLGAPTGCRATSRRWRYLP